MILLHGATLEESMGPRATLIGDVKEGRAEPSHGHV